MITRVWGEINGVGSVPMFNFGDEYYFSPPQTLTGRYVCQFWAEDDSGNITNRTAILYIESGVIKNIELTSREWIVTMLRNPWDVDVFSDAYSMELGQDGVTALKEDIWTIHNVTGQCKDAAKYKYIPIRWNEVEANKWVDIDGRTWNQMRKRMKIEG